VTEVTRSHLAEEVGFEPTVPGDTAVFETARFGRSRTPPSSSLQRAFVTTFGASTAVWNSRKFVVVDDTANDELFMRAAIDMAIVAAGHQDVPVGCVLVANDVVIGVGENRRELDQDPTSHAEIVALRDAALSRPSWRMEDVTAYVTLEPCVMCAGALLNARVRRVVIGALDEKAGAVGSRYNVLSDPRLLHEASLTYGVFGEESAELLRDFFLERRAD
jgi:tRNA(adenine34) deaminase